MVAKSFSLDHSDAPERALSSVGQETQTLPQPPRKKLDNRTDEFEMGVSFRVFNGAMRRRRVQLKLTQAQLGEIVGKSNVIIGRYENLTLKPDNETLAKIATALGCAADDLWPAWLEAFRAPAQGTTTKMVGAGEFSALTAGARRELKALPSPKDSLEREEALSDARQSIDIVLATLTYREREILKLRFGIGSTGGETYTLDECSRIFKVCRERIRSIEARAMNKLRHSGRSLKLQPHAEALIGVDNCPRCATVVGKFVVCDKCKSVGCPRCDFNHRHRCRGTEAGA